jgi:MSHA biogenesis protein MshO
MLKHNPFLFAKLSLRKNSSLKVRPSGFTLVELILVIIILGVVGIATTQYLSLGAQIYADATERDEAVAQSRFMLARLTRELRHATPNSVRLSCSAGCTSNGEQCLEFTPFKASTIYTGNITQNPFVVVNPADAVSLNDLLSVYALTADDVYNLSKTGKKVSQLTAKTAVTAGNPTSSWTVDNAFTVESPTKRVFVLSQPVSFCIEGSKLYRYDNYGFAAGPTYSQSTPSGNNKINGKQGILLGQFIQNNIATTPFFNYGSASLTRNSVVNIRSEMGFNNTETVSFNHEIHLPNVP